MNIFVAILGLGLLVLVHEAGHFFTARAVGMSPRRFYIGFPPALVRVKRKGIEYGIGAIPLGGYVKIPGMHRPAPSDLETFFGPALAEAPQLLAPLERIKRKFEEGDMEGARPLLAELEQAVEEVGDQQRARKAARRGLNELKDGLGQDAYWRQRTWKKVLVIFAGPGHEPPVRDHPLRRALRRRQRRATGWASRWRPTLRSSRPSAPIYPAATMGLRPGDRIVSINGEPVTSVS